MKLYRALHVLALLCTLICAPPLLAQGTRNLDEVAQAMGGKDRVLAVRTLIIEGSGEQLYFGQTITPYAKTYITVTAFRRSYDFVNRRMLLEQTRESRYLSPMPPPLHVRFGVDDTVGYNLIGDNPMARAATNLAVDRAAELIYHPIGFLQAAYAPGNRLTEDMEGGARRFRLAVGSQTFTMLVDRRTNLPFRVSRVIDHPMLGDVALNVELSDWRDAGELKLPMRVVQRQERFTLSDYHITSARINVDPAIPLPTDSVRAAPVISPIAYSVVPEEVVPGVWILDSGLYHTIAVEQSDKIVLVEAPENDARTLAAIAKARELRPGKSVGPMVTSHAHFDHAGGVRAAISQGLTIITHEANKDFFEHVVYPGRHTLQPDALQNNPKPLKITPVHKKLVLRDSLRTIELYEVPGVQHSRSMVLAYLPSERILIEADLETPDLIAVIQRLGLDVQLVLGLHNRPMPWPPR